MRNNFKNGDECSSTYCSHDTKCSEGVKCATNSCSDKSNCCLIKKINTHLSALNQAANAHESIKSRIGENSIKTVKLARSKTQQNSVASDLNNLMESYVALCNLVAKCESATTWDRGNAESSLNKRISAYIGKIVVYKSSWQI